MWETNNRRREYWIIDAQALGAEVDARWLAGQEDVTFYDVRAAPRKGRAADVW